MAYNKLKQGVEIMQTATQGSKPRYFLNGKEISEQEAMEPASPGIGGPRGGGGSQAGAPKPMDGVPPGVDPEEWKQFLQSRPQNVFDGGQRPMMVGGQGYQGPMMVGGQGPGRMLNVQMPPMGPTMPLEGPKMFGPREYPQPMPMMPQMPAMPQMSPKEREAAIAADKARYMASIMPPAPSPAITTKPMPQRQPPIQVGGGAVGIAPVDPGMTITPEQKPAVSPASTDIKPKPAKEPPQRMPPESDPSQRDPYSPGSMRDRKKKARIKPKGVK